MLDVEAVQVCIDRVRELGEHDAWLAGLSGRREPAVGAVGGYGVLLPGMPAELLPPGLGRALRVHPRKSRLRHRALPRTGTGTCSADRPLRTANVRNA